MARSWPEASVVMLTRQDKLDRLVSREGIRMSQEMESCQSPVDAIEAKMFGQPVFELIFPLLVMSIACLMMDKKYSPCPDSVYT